MCPHEKRGVCPNIQHSVRSARVLSSCLYTCLLVPKATPSLGLPLWKAELCAQASHCPHGTMPLTLLQRAGGCKFYPRGCRCLKVLHDITHPSLSVPIPQSPGVILQDYSTILPKALFCISVSNRAGATAASGSARRKAPGEAPALAPALPQERLRLALQVIPAAAESQTLKAVAHESLSCQTVNNIKVNSTDLRTALTKMQFKRSK